MHNELTALLSFQFKMSSFQTPLPSTRLHQPPSPPLFLSPPILGTLLEIMSALALKQEKPNIFGIFLFTIVFNIISSP